jgi:hypothetical protein
VITDHCGSLPLFARAYGLSVVLIAAAAAFWLVRRPKIPGFSDRTLAMLFWGLALCLLAQPIGFVLFDFLFSPEIEERWAQHISVWARARLLESWFYGGILIALVLFLKGAEPRERRWAQTAMMVATALYLFNPLTIPAQMTANAAYLVHAVLGR